MARKRYSDEDVLRLLREIEPSLAEGLDVESACRKAGVSDATYYNWRKKFGGVSKSQLAEKKALEKESAQLKPIVVDLELDTLLRPEDWVVNHKKVERLWREEGLQPPKRHKMRKRLYHKDSSAIRLRRQYRNHIWSVDFVYDELSSGRPY